MLIPIHKEIDPVLAKFVERKINQAEKDDIKQIILDIHTPGGTLQSALKLSGKLRKTDIPVTAYINTHALSAGAYVALSADSILVNKQSKMGAAAVIRGDGGDADKKTQSFWLAELKETAESSGRDPVYALAMADPSIHLPQLNAGKGRLLTLTGQQALQIGYAEGEANSLQEVLALRGLSYADTERPKEGFAEHTARLLTSPAVIPILLTVALVGLLLELYTPGFGIFGFIGLSALFLFFFGHLAAGLAGMDAVLFFAAGILLLIAELFLPGGIIGLAGAAAIGYSLFISADNPSWMGISIGIALAVCFIVFILLTKVFGKKMKFFKKFILTDQTDTKSGYISNKSRSDLIGQHGVCLTALRPAGTVLIGDERIDAVSEGTFTEKGKTVKVVKTEGMRVVVREIEPAQ
ncbi:nodulation protein NfeD [Bacillus sp. FJAT-42376]|uniref:NfeD family protein n=1 Tax=Bacillus sp. FJAT-42376 TaxID=2014076 RepID=UPI001F14B7AB|nr:nodulation protein NfeD [Bacillus sp. FJAT-42376]